jgi:hypothetical protein
MARYIDAEELYKRVKDNVGAYYASQVDVKDECLEEIENMPTADVAPKSEVVNILSDLKKEIHDKAVYPHLSGVEPYISLKVFDAVINKLIGS